MTGYSENVRIGRNKKSRRGGMVDYVILDRDRVCHRTALKLSFARA
jgi:hypothetical protein